MFGVLFDIRVWLTSASTAILEGKGGELRALSVRNISLSELVFVTPRSKMACLRVLRVSRAKALSPMW